MASETWDISTVSSAGITLSSDGKTAEQTGTATRRGIRTTNGKSSGKWYIELENLGADSGAIHGLMDSASQAPAFAGESGSNSVGWQTNGVGVGDGNCAAPTSIGSTIAPSGVLAFAIDADTGEIWIRNDSGSWAGGGSPTSGTTPTTTLSCVVGAIHLCLGLSASGAKQKLLSTHAELKFAPPTDFSPWGGGEYKSISENFTSVLPISLDTNGVKSTGSLNASYVPGFSFTEDGLPKTGSYSGSQWLVSSAGDQKLNVKFDAPVEIEKLRINNSHASGAYGNDGVETLEIYGTNSQTAFENTTYADLTDLTLLDTLTLREHVFSDVADDQYFELASTGEYQYLVFRETSHFGGTYKGIRAIEMFRGNVVGDYVPKFPAEFTANTVQATTYYTAGSFYAHYGADPSAVSDWYSMTAPSSADQKWCVKYADAVTLTRLTLINSQSGDTLRGIDNFEIWGANSEDAFDNIADFNDDTSLTLIESGLSAAPYNATTNPSETFDFTNETAYIYYMLKISDNHGGDLLGFRQATFATPLKEDAPEGGGPLTMDASFAFGANGNIGAGGSLLLGLNADFILAPSLKLGGGSAVDIEGQYVLGGAVKVGGGSEVTIEASFAFGATTSVGEITYIDDVSIGYVLGATLFTRSDWSMNTSLSLRFGAAVEVSPARNIDEVNASFRLSNRIVSITHRNEIHCNFGFGGSLVTANVLPQNYNVGFVLGANVAIEGVSTAIKVVSNFTLDTDVELQTLPSNSIYTSFSLGADIVMKSKSDLTIITNFVLNPFATMSGGADGCIILGHSTKRWT